jgi:hypothetical protein
MNNIREFSNEDKPEFWLIEDGSFFLADSRDVYKCMVCNEWYLAKDGFTGSQICSPGCRLRSNEIKKLP